MMWLNGARVDPDSARISPLDHGFTVGDGVFETLKVSEGVPFARDRHLRRLTSSAAGLGITIADLDAVGARLDAAAAASPWPLARLRVTITSGIGPAGSARGDSGLTELIVLVEAQPTPATAAVITVPWRRNEHSAIAGLKTTSYAENVVALERAAAAGASEALFANTRGQLCEGTGSNVFVVRAGAVLTPPLSSGCLAGITRGLVLEWGAAAGLDVREQDLDLDELESADEVFLTSSTRDVQPVSAIDGRALAAPGPVTQQLQQVWRANEASDPNP